MFSPSHPLIGKIAIDRTVEDFTPAYLIGEKGFLSVEGGVWFPYDSAFNGPSFFENPAFEIVEFVAPPAQVSTNP